MPIRFVPISSISTSKSIVFFLLFDIPESPVAALIVTESSVVELACVFSSAYIVQRDRFVQPRRANGHNHTVHGCWLLGVATDDKFKGVRELKKRRNQWSALLLVRGHRLESRWTYLKKQPSNHKPIKSPLGDAYSVDIRRRPKLTVSPACHMEQYLDIIQLNARDIL